MRLTPVILAAAVALVAGLSGLAGAQVSAPPPGCAGMAAEDVAGDQLRNDPVAGESVGEGPTYLDLEGLYFTFSGGKAYANVRIANLTTDIDPGTATRWYVVYQVGSAHKWVRAAIAATGALTYGYGDYNVDDESFTPVGDAKGSMVEGEHGVISIEIPAAAGGKNGGRLVNPFAVTYEAYSAGVQNLLAPASDRAPDEGSGKTYDIGACESGGTPVATATPDPAVTPEPTPGPSEGGGGGAPQTETAVQSGALQISLASKAPRLKKANRAKTLAFKLKSKGAVTEIQARLLDGKNKVVGTGKLAKLSGKGTLKVKRSKKLKKGTYTLLLAGKNPDGRGADKAFKLKFK